MHQQENRWVAVANRPARRLQFIAVMNTNRIARVIANQKRNFITDYLASVALIAGLLTSAAALF